MAYRSVIAAAVFTALLAGSAQAQTSAPGCRKRCDASYSSCSKTARGDACLRSWHACKNQCKAPAAAATPRKTLVAAKTGRR